MSGQVKVKSLSLSRRSQTTPRKEENVKSQIAETQQAQISNLEAILNSPIARPSRLCSTPIQKNVELMEDSPDQDFRDSPTSLYPCTQDSNEIAWDWQSGINREIGSPGRVDKSARNGLGGLNHTPKRPQQLFPKKRATKAYSPLLNVPNKRKLANEDVVQSIEKFAAELTALAQELKTEQDSDSTERKKNAEEKAGDVKPGTSNQPAIFDLETQAPFDIHEVPTLETSDVAEEKTDPEKPESSLDDLFDDSVDACMVQCSQEVEDKLKLSSGGAEGKLLPGLSNDGKKAGSGAATSSANQSNAPKSCSVNIESRYNGKIKKQPSFSDLISGERSKTNIPEKDIPASQIPDDSFDDCLALCLEDDDELMNKFLQEKKPGVPNKPSSASTSNPPDASSSFKRKQQCMGPETALATTQSRKYFKAKSLSDSYCGNLVPGKKGGSTFAPNSNLGRSYPPPTAKSGSNFKPGGKFGANEAQAKVSSTPNLNNCVPAAGGRSSSSINPPKPVPGNKVSYSYIKNGISNVEAGKSGPGIRDPYGNYGRRDEKPLSELRTTAPTSSQYNAEEIERKRLEAKMRLEANRLRKQVNSNRPNGAGFSLQNKRPIVKR